MNRPIGRAARSDQARIARFDRRSAFKAFACSLLLACGMSAGEVHAAGGVAASDQGAGHRVNIRIVAGSTTMAATMDDNPTARDFVTQLPVTLTLRDLDSAEKVSGALPRRLTEAGAPARDAGSQGEIAYYAPWGNIAFYRGQGPDAAGVITIGRITSGIEAVNQQGQLTVTISRAD